MPAPWVLPAAIGMNALGSFITGSGQNKVNQQQLKLEREKLRFQIEQALRGNRIADANTAQVSPLMLQMLARSQENMGARPQQVRLQPPNINNRYQPGVGSAGNPAPPQMQGLPWLGPAQNSSVASALEQMRAAAGRAGGV